MRHISNFLHSPKYYSRNTKQHTPVIDDDDRALDEFLQLREDDKDFAEQYDDTAEDFNEWYTDLYTTN